MKPIFCFGRISMLMCLGCFIFLASCKKEPLIQDDLPKVQVSSANISNAKLFLENSIQKNIISSSSQNKKREFTLLKSTQLGSLINIIDWDNSFFVQLDGINFLVSEIKESIKIFNDKGYQFMRFLVLRQEENHYTDMTVLEILGDKNYTFKQSGKMLADAMLKNYFKKLSDSISDVSASVMFFDKNYLIQKSFVLTNGVWSAKRVHFRSDLQIVTK